MTSSDDDVSIVSANEEPLTGRQLQLRLMHNLVTLDEPCPSFRNAFERFVSKNFKGYYPPDIVAAVFERIHRARARLAKTTPFHNSIESASILVSDSDDSSSDANDDEKVVDLTQLSDSEPTLPSIGDSVNQDNDSTPPRIQVTNARLDSVHVQQCKQVVADKSIQTIAFGESDPCRPKKRRVSEPVKSVASSSPAKKPRRRPSTLEFMQKEANLIRTRLLLSKIVELSLQSDYYKKQSEQISKKKKKKKGSRLKKFNCEI